MGSIATIISNLKYSRSQLLESIAGLSQRELTEIPIYQDWTIKDVLGHVIGWDRRVINTMPLMLQNRAAEIPGVEVEDYNQQSVNAWRDKSLTQILAEIQSTHQQILDILTSVDHVEIDMRRQREGRIITIRSYVIDIMAEHERQHAAEINQWRKDLDQINDPAAIKTMLKQNKIDFMALLDQFDEADVLNKSAVGIWSISDLVGHVAGWEQLIIKAANHIYDPSQPPVSPVSNSLDHWNEIMVAERAKKSWPENYCYLRQTQAATADFVAKLKPGDWKLRGPYPWPNDRGTLAELLSHAAEHCADHLSDLERWFAKTTQPQPAVPKPWIRWLFDQEASGRLKKEYDAALKRAGRIWNILRVMSLNPPAMQASRQLYGAVVHRSTKLLGRPEREMIAVVVSQANHCHY